MDGALLREQFRFNVLMYELGIVWTQRHLQGEKPPESLARSLVAALRERSEVERLHVVAASAGVDLDDDSDLVAKRRELDLECANLLATVGGDKVTGLLIETLGEDVEIYGCELRYLYGEYQAGDAQEYAETVKNDDLYYTMQCLVNRTTIDSLVARLGDAVPPGMRERLCEADALLHSEGKHLFGPPIDAGTIQTMRERGFEPSERWWYYLDQLPDAENGQD